MSRLHAEVVDVGKLDRRTRWAMCALLDQHFEGVTRAVFERDLEAKDHALLLRDGSGALRGFTTLAVTRHRVGGAALPVLHSGDTIVDRAHWGSLALPMAWIGAVRALRDRHGGRMVWLLICSGPRTYRFLPVFFRQYVPRATTGAPDLREGAQAALKDVLAAARYGDAYDAETGIVRLREPQRLRASIRDLPGVRRDRHVRLFEELNPGATEGDELVCLADLADTNLTRAGLRMVTGKRAQSRSQVS